MPKIISGTLKGRHLKGYNILGTRPTMDRVKESVFGMIQDKIVGSCVLDLFSGTGNYGIECLSNGAELAYFNDYNHQCTQIIKENLADFHLLDNSVITKLDYREALKKYVKENVSFDIIFLDPPYKDQIINQILTFIIKNNLLKEKGLVVCELVQKEEYQSDKLVLYKERKYGEKTVLIYKLV